MCLTLLSSCDVSVSISNPSFADGDLELKLLSFTGGARQDQSSQRVHLVPEVGIARGQLEGPAYGERKDEID
jgi:hypothetical protein